MRLHCDIEMVDLGDEYIAVPMGNDASKTSGVIRLNRTGYEIMKLFINGVSEDDATDYLNDIYDNSYDELQSFVKDVANKLIENGLAE